jgi:hypothetical protein
MCLGGGDYYLSRMQILEAQILAIIMIACSMEIASLCVRKFLLIGLDRATTASLRPRKKIAKLAREDWCVPMVDGNRNWRILECHLDILLKNQQPIQAMLVCTNCIGISSALSRN